MAKRITIMIDEDLDKKLRMIQAKQIAKDNKSVSYSKVLNEAVRTRLTR